MHINGALTYPCEFFTLYTSDMNTVPTTLQFDYMIRARYLDLILPNSNLAIYTNDLMQRIKNTWYSSNNISPLNLTMFDVQLADTQLYTSKFQSLIQRVYYFLTIGNKNVNDDITLLTYNEPTLSSFDQNLGSSADVTLI